MNKLLYSFILSLLLLSGCFNQTRLQPPDEIVVLKSQRQMLLIHEGEVYKIYDIGLGQDPEGHKEQQGDSRTPEGRYSINGRNPNSKYYLSLRISYPDEDDIANAKAKGVDPGDHIMIHGMRGKGTRAEFIKAGDWTEGCIAITNEEMRELWDSMRHGTPITIYP